MTEQELIEQLADKEHKGWSSYMAYLFSKLESNPDGSLTIPPGYVTALQIQIDSSYAELSEQEKQYDRDEVAHILPIIREYALSQCGSSGEMAAMAWGSVNAHQACISDLQRQVQTLMDEVFCTHTNRPATRDKTLLGDVRELRRLVFSLQGEEAREQKA